MISGQRARYALLAVVLLVGPFATLATVVVTTAPGVFRLDAEVAAHLHRLVAGHPGRQQALRVIGAVSEPYVLRAIALVVAGGLWWRGRGRAAGWLVLTMAIGGGLGVLLKLTFTRDRPYWPDPITVISGYSFPSGHAVNSMLAAICALVLLNPVLGPTGRRLLPAAITGFVLLVGLDRLALGVHYLTDVLAGWTLALIVVLSTLAGLGRPSIQIQAGDEKRAWPLTSQQPGP